MIDIASNIASAPGEYADRLALERAKVQETIPAAERHVMTASEDDNAASGFRRRCEEADLARLAALDTFAYAQVRKESAAAFNMPVSWLDKAIEDHRKKSTSESTTVTLPEKWKVEPWEETVAGAVLLDDLRATIERYVVLPEHASATMALWTMHAWTIDAAFVSPFLMFSSPEMRCGKSTALALINRCAPRSAMASNISKAALFRYVETSKPTLLIDEAETFAIDNEELRGILNSGHTRDTACVIRLVGDNHEPREFSTWSPKAIASIGKLAATLRDRAIIISMQRKNPGERVAKLRSRTNDSEFLILRRKACRWSADNIDALQAARPEIPGLLNDRASDNWEALLAIADLAGGNWPALACAAAVGLSNAAEADLPSIRIQLLADSRQLFDNLSVDRLSSKTLVAELVADDDAPWATYSRGKPITAKQIARLLSDFGIHTRTMRIPGAVGTPKTYARESFEGAWARYLPDTPFSSATPQHCKQINGLDSIRSGTLASNVADESSGNPLNNNGCCGVTDENPLAEPPKHKCAQCNGTSDGTERAHEIGGREVWLHPECRPFCPEGDGWGLRR